jgi:hypothetical protein
MYVEKLILGVHITLEPLKYPLTSTPQSQHKGIVLSYIYIEVCLVLMVAM